MRKNIIWNEIQAGLMEAIFPKEIPTHNQRQRFWFDRDTGLLLQHNYTAEVISSLAKAAHVVLDHSESKGLKFTAHWMVKPISAKWKPMRGPTFI
jgi:hypothetical protein